jgi:hypothetical protein
MESHKKFCRQQPGGDEASNEGCNSGPTGHDFPDNSNFWEKKTSNWQHPGLKMISGSRKGSNNNNNNNSNNNNLFLV